MDKLQTLVQERFGVELDEFCGGHLSGELPVTAAVVNQLIAAQLAARQTPVKAIRVEPLDGNQIDVQVTPATWLVPTIRIRAAIERQPQLPDSPFLVLRWTLPAAGPLVRLAGPFLANLKSLPRGITLDADFAVVNLRELLAGQGHDDLLPYVKTLRVDTRPGAFLVRFEVGV